ncbi:MAG TPA: PAS domain S-box protein [Solirubrobacteraceae bacterium]|nr:PAS domain S-box protein [Solirubrobacteraceae bacterium]
MSDPFRSLFMANPVPTSVTRAADGTVLYANPACLELLGWEESEFVGRTVHELGLWARPERRPAIMEELRRTGRIDDLEEELSTKDGETVSVLMSISSLDLDGERCVQGAYYDIDERRRREGRIAESEENFRQVLDTVQQGFVLRDFDPPAVLYASPGVAQIFGIELAEVYGDPGVLERMIHPDDLEAVTTRRDAMTGPSDFEFRIVRPSGERRWVRTRAQPVNVEAGQVARVAAVVDDVTEERALHDALSASEERFRLLVSSVTDYAIIMLDPVGRVTGWNPGAERIKGYSAEEIVGRHFSVFYPPELVASGHPERELEAALAVGRYQEEGERVRKDGSRYWADVILTTVYDDGGELRGFVKVMRDVTAGRAAEGALRESEERFRILAENSTDVITRASPEETLLYVSPSSRALYGYGPEELTGRSFLADIHPADRAELREELADEDGRDEHTLEYRIRRKDGSFTWVETKTRTLRDGDGGVAEYQSSTRDISARRAAEAAARRAQTQAEQANSAKSEFLSRMSHELRTPLHAILGFGELLARDELMTGQRDKLGQLTKAAHHLLDLINEVLDLSRIERGELRLSLEPVHLGDVIRETLGMVLPIAAAASVTVAAPPDEDVEIHVLADRQRLKQVLLNLCSNAVKYNRPGGAVTIRCAQSGTPKARIAVLDTGIGIAPANLARVFEPFDRLGAETTDIEGTGLGLALSQRLIEAMGGTVGVESTVGVGTTFTVELPLVPAPAAPRQSPGVEVHAAPERSPGRARTVLYVEDNPSNIKLVESILTVRPEVTLIVSTQGGLALELAREHRPALVLLDLNLPDISGEEVLRRLRGDARTADTPVVITSADATPGHIDHLRRAGANDYLTKPFSIERFLSVIDRSPSAGMQEVAVESEPAGPAQVLDPAAIQSLHELAAKPNVGAGAITQLLNTYLADALERCAGIEVAILERDLAEVKRQAHALGGASGWAGATDALRRCRKLEATAEQGDEEGARSAAAGLRHALLEAHSALEEEFGPLDPSQAQL